MTENSLIVWGISGGIALYKSLDIIHGLKKDGYAIQVVMTKNASKFINPITFAAITGREVIIDTFAKPMAHIEIADKASLFIIAPATYNIIGKLASGIADDCLTSIAAAILLDKKVIAPAMNSNMYNNPILQDNLSLLRKYNYKIIDPDEGMLACGYEGLGRLRNNEYIDNFVRKLMEEDDSLLDESLSFLNGKDVLITAGGTREAIDPVRFIGNRSSGKMGVALAKACMRHGARVTFVYAGIDVLVPSGLRAIHAPSAKDMHFILDKELLGADILIMSAAISDYSPKQISKTKIKKGKAFKIDFVENPDILKSLKDKKRKGQVFIGFAAESEDIIKNASYKLDCKKLDLIVANDITRDDIAFGSDYNEVVLIAGGGFVKKTGVLSKDILSIVILKELGRLCFAS